MSAEQSAKKSFRISMQTLFDDTQTKDVEGVDTKKTSRKVDYFVNIVNVQKKSRGSVA